MSDTEAFEKAIIANPDERATYSAYADWLQERDDPRGEFIAVQLALEDESRSKSERDSLKAREAELLKAHEREWLGVLAPHLLNDRVPNTIEYRWRRGVLTSLQAALDTAFSHALADAPAARFLQSLNVEGEGLSDSDADEPAYRIATPDGVDYHHPLFEMIGSECFQSLRVFRLGDEESEPPEDGWCDCHTHISGLEHVLADMPRIEELHLLCNGYKLQTFFALPNLTNLRVLRAYHLGSRECRDARSGYPLDVLAANPAFGNLTHLQFHPHQSEEGRGGDEISYIPLEQVQNLISSPHLNKLTHLQLRLSDMGDDGVRDIIESGFIRQLKWLDLRHGCITDDGARLLAACPEAKRLERIDLSYNGVTATGLAELRKAKINAVANKPLTQSQLDEREYLRQGDFE
jgi:uncharacterized protein (TIGR02996 family)